MIKILIADDHKVLLDGFISIFKDQSDIEVVGTANNGNEVVKLLEEINVDVVLLDINMPILNGVETCKKITRQYPDIKVIALSMYKQVSYIKRMKQNGAKGYLLKDDTAGDIISAIKKIHDGGESYSPRILDLVFQASIEPNTFPNNQITNREKDVVSLITKGLTTKEIGERLFISAHTVDSHRKSIMSKLGAKNAAELVSICIDKGLI